MTVNKGKSYLKGEQDKELAHFAVRDCCAYTKNNGSGIPAFVLKELKKIKNLEENQ